MAYTRFIRAHDTATVATVATLQPKITQSVANVATVATSQGQNGRRGDANVATVATVAGIGSGAPVAANDGALSSSSPWWQDREEVRYRFEEGSAIREFDDGLPRDDAERITIECLIRELQEMGLTRAEAEELLRDLERAPSKAIH